MYRTILCSLCLLGLMAGAASATEISNQTFDLAGGTGDQSGNSQYLSCAYGFAQWPAGVSTPTLSAGTICSPVFSPFTSTAPTLGSSGYGHFTWTSTESGGTITAGGRLGVGYHFHRFCSASTGDLEVTVRAMVNETDRFGKMTIRIEDNNGLTVESTDRLANFTDATWREESLTTDLSASPWSGNAGTDFTVIVYFEGTSTAANKGLTEVDIQSISVRQTQ